MALWGSHVGFGWGWRYVFPRYENVCAAYDLCALPAVRVANSLRAAQALVSLCALASSIFAREKSPAVVIVNRSARSAALLDPRHQPTDVAAHLSCLGAFSP